MFASHFGGKKISLESDLKLFRNVNLKLKLSTGKLELLYCKSGDQTLISILILIQNMLPNSKYVTKFKICYQIQNMLPNSKYVTKLIAFLTHERKIRTRGVTESQSRNTKYQLNLTFSFWLVCRSMN